MSQPDDVPSSSVGPVAGGRKSTWQRLPSRLASSAFGSSRRARRARSWLANLRNRCSALAALEVAGTTFDSVAPDPGAIRLRRHAGNEERSPPGRPPQQARGKCVEGHERLRLGWEAPAVGPNSATTRRRSGLREAVNGTAGMVTTQRGNM